MNLAFKSFEPKPGSQGGPRVSRVDDWTVWEYATVDSTNLVAARLKAWEAVRADTQTAGRGRFQRVWVSDLGGLWLSAVVPTGSNAHAWRALPLAAGLAVAEALRGLGLKDLRLRWPNDLMVADRKLAGLLVDTFHPGLAVIGVGVNVINQPEARDTALRNLTVRLTDLLPQTPALPEITRALLASIRGVVEQMGDDGFSGLHPRVNRLWGQSRRVELELEAGVRRGLFTGIDPEGRLLLREDSGATAVFETHQVKHLQELI